MNSEEQKQEDDKKEQMEVFSKVERNNIYFYSIVACIAISLIAVCALIYKQGGDIFKMSTLQVIKSAEKPSAESTAEAAAKAAKAAADAAAAAAANKPPRT